MRALWLAGWMIAIGGCTSDRPASLIMPGQVRRALSQLSGLTAAAELVSRDGTHGSPVLLEPAADGISFSGFITADPGDYQLEVVFKGVAAGRPDVLFLGRWISDGFTVSLGSTANPSFTQPLDTIGRAGDGGDPDGDRFGNLDEILWSTDPSAADSDNDGVGDGADCAPDDPSNAFTIVSGGTIEDCDGDGARRPDVPFGGGGGNDCDDRNPTVRPGAADECSDSIDQDCNPSTCPSNDMTAPSIGAIDPPSGSTVGCHTRVRADVTDDGAVAYAYVYLDEPVPGDPVSLYMQRGEGDQFVAPPFNDGIGLDGLLTGTRALEIRTQDNGGNMTAVPLSYDFEYEIPALSSMTPADVGTRSAPFDMQLTASAPRGVALLQLMAVQRSGAGTYNTATAVELGRSTTGSGTFNVDPATMADGEYLLYAVVTDTIGNQLRPFSYPSPIGGNNGLEVDADYRCIAMPLYPKMPARVLIVGQNAYQPVRMRELLDQAIAQAAATDPQAELVSIIGYGVGDDGRVGLDDAASYIKRWQYAFFNASTQRAVTVSWYTPAYITENPVIDPNAGNVSAAEPILNPELLVDSDAAVAAANGAGCPQVGGTDDDWILYQSVDQALVVSIYNQTGTSWRGTATAPITEIFSCN